MAVVGGTSGAGHRWSDEEMVFGWYDEERVSGAVITLPPYELVLAVMPDGLVDELATELHARPIHLGPLPATTAHAAD